MARRTTTTTTTTTATTTTTDDNNPTDLTLSPVPICQRQQFQYARAFDLVSYVSYGLFGLKLSVLLVSNRLAGRKQLIFVDFFFVAVIFSLPTQDKTIALTLTRLFALLLLLYKTG